MIRFNAKNRFWKHPQKGNGLYENVYVEPTSATVDTNNKRLTVDFQACMEASGLKEVIGTGQLVFTEAHLPTIISNELNEPQEVVSYLMAGGAYLPEKIIDWGWPSFARVQAYFAKESVWTGLEFADSPFIQLAVDWVRYNLAIDGHKILTNDFDYQKAQLR